MRLNNLKRYFPETLFNGGGIQYFIDENGNDWFKSLPDFKKEYAIAFDEKGIIRFYGDDPSRFYPVGLSVVDIDSLPDGLNVMGEWIFDGKKIIPRELSGDELITKAENDKARLLKQANEAIAPLERAVRLNMSTEQEAQQLAAWERYSVLLNRVDISTAPDIVWPEQPDNVA